MAGTIEPIRSLSDPLPFLLLQGPSENSAIRAQVGKRLRTGSVAEAVKLDMQMTSALNPITSAVIKDCLPGGQRRPFPKNTMSLMTITGAKGSMVSCSPRFASAHLVGSRTLSARIGFCPKLWEMFAVIILPESLSRGACCNSSTTRQRITRY
jgi:hypothetical protein